MNPEAFHVIDTVLGKCDSVYFLSVMTLFNKRTSKVESLCSIACSVPLPVRYMEHSLSDMNHEYPCHHRSKIRKTVDIVHEITSRIGGELPMGMEEESRDMQQHMNMNAHPKYRITLSLFSEPNIQEQNDVSFKDHHHQFWSQDCPDEIYVSIFQFLPINDLVNINASCLFMHEKVNVYDGLIWKVYFDRCAKRLSPLNTWIDWSEMNAQDCYRLLMRSGIISLSQLNLGSLCIDDSIQLSVMNSSSLGYRTKLKTKYCRIKTTKSITNTLACSIWKHASSIAQCRAPPPVHYPFLLKSISDGLMDNGWKQPTRPEFWESVIHHTILFYILYRASNGKQKRRLVPPFWILLGLHFMDRILTGFDESYNFAHIWGNWLVHDKGNASEALGREWIKHFGFDLDESFHHRIRMPTFKPYFELNALECYGTLRNLSNNVVRFMDRMVNQLYAKRNIMNRIGINDQSYTLTELVVQVKSRIPYLKEDYREVWLEERMKNFFGSYNVLQSTFTMTCMSDTWNLYSGRGHVGDRVILAPKSKCTLDDTKWRMNSYGQIEFVAHPDLVIGFDWQQMGLVLEKKADCYRDIETFIQQLWILESDNNNGTCTVLRSLLNTCSFYLTAFLIDE